LMSSSRITNKANLSLAYFVVRFQSLLFYREILKTIRKLDPNIAQEVKKEARVKFESNRHVTDPEVARHLLVTGRQEFKELRKAMSLAGIEN
jgi:hypothetical protein